MLWEYSKITGIKKERRKSGERKEKRERVKMMRIKQHRLPLSLGMGDNHMAARCGHSWGCGTCHLCPLGAAEPQPGFTERGRSRESSPEQSREKHEGESQKGQDPPIPVWPWLFPRHQQRHCLGHTRVTELPHVGSIPSGKGRCCLHDLQRGKWFIIMNNEFLQMLNGAKT